jgi:hypothetical protein
MTGPNNPPLPKETTYVLRGGIGIARDALAQSVQYARQAFTKLA